MAPAHPPPSSSPRRPPPPPLRTPLGYLGFGLASLLGGLGMLVWQPDLPMGGLLAPPVVALVHLVTLGFVTATILGSLYLVSPFALRARMGEGPWDVAGLVVYASGVAGMVTGFATGELTVAVGHSPLVLLGMGWVATRSLVVLARSELSAPSKLPFALAWIGLTTTVAIGVLHGLDRGGGFLGGSIADRVAAHAHLGLAGWLLVMVMAAGGRLLPMVLPSAMLAGWRAWLPPGIVMAGALLYAVGRITAAEGTAQSGAVTMAAGVAAFLGNVGWMLRHRRKPGPAVPRPDLPKLSALSSLLCLTAATGVGLSLALGFYRPRLVAVYGILALLGFFGQLIFAMEQRLVPWLLWMRAHAAAGFRKSPPAPYRLPLRGLQAFVLGSWAVGPWVLALGTLAGSEPIVRWAAATLALATAAHMIVLWSYGRLAYGMTPSYGAGT